MSYFDRVAIETADSASVDAFGRLRTSGLDSLFDAQLQYDLHRLFWEDVTAGSATVAHRADEASARLTVTASASDSVIRQSREYLRYQPGKSQAIAMTFVAGSAVEGVTKRVGYFDGENGIFLEQDGTTALNIVRRTNVTGTAVDNEVAQASWNIDPMDGTGKSGVTLDLSKSQILFIDLQWLGVGRVRVGFEVDGKLYYAHEFLNTNSLALVYMTTANLPVRYEISSNGTNGDSMDCICAHVASEGGFETGRGVDFSANRGRTADSVGTSQTPTISIRPKATFNSIVNRGLIIPKSFSIYTGAAGVLFEVIYGGTLTSAAFTSAGADSIVEYDVSASAISGGIVMGSFYVNRQSNFDTTALHRLPLTLNQAGSHPTSPYTDVLTLAGTKIASGTVDCHTSLNWTEFR